MKKLFPVIVASLVVLGLVSSCAPPVPAGKAKYAIIFKNTGNPYGEKEMEGFKNAVEELGAEAILKAPDQPTAEAQIAMIEELIAQKVAVIAMVGNDKDASYRVKERLWPSAKNRADEQHDGDDEAGCDRARCRASAQKDTWKKPVTAASP